jgi:DNA-binding NarL/FixJ family response regulator
MTHPEPTPAPPAHVVIVEDDARTRALLAAAIGAAAGYALAGAFATCAEALAWLDGGQRPDVLLTDLGLPDGSGIDVIRACAARWPGCSILVISMFGDDRNVLAAIEAGAGGYILKDSAEFDVARALGDLRNGGAPMSPLIARKVLDRAAGRHAPAPAAEPAVALTRREADTLDLIARGYTYEETAHLLAVSLSTVQTHIRAIYRKLCVNSRSEAVFEANKLGLLQDGLLKPDR